MQLPPGTVIATREAEVFDMFVLIVVCYFTTCYTTRSDSMLQRTYMQLQVVY